MQKIKYIIKNGVPFDVAFAMGQLDIEEWYISFVEMEGHEKFNFKQMAFQTIKRT